MKCGHTYVVTSGGQRVYTHLGRYPSIKTFFLSLKRQYWYYIYIVNALASNTMKNCVFSDLNSQWNNVKTRCFMRHFISYFIMETNRFHGQGNNQARRISWHRNSKGIHCVFLKRKHVTFLQNWSAEELMEFPVLKKLTKILYLHAGYSRVSLFHVSSILKHIFVTKHRNHNNWYNSLHMSMWKVEYA